MWPYLYNLRQNPFSLAAAEKVAERAVATITDQPVREAGTGLLVKEAGTDPATQATTTAPEKNMENRLKFTSVSLNWTAKRNLLVFY